MNRVKALTCIVLAMAIGWAITTMGHLSQTRNDAMARHTGVTIEQIQNLSSLVTTRVNVADVVETQLSGYTGSMKAAIIVKGDFLLGVDLMDAKVESVDDIARKVVISLPSPRATNPRLDHEGTKVFMITETGLWLIAPGGAQASAKVIDQGYRSAQHYLIDAGNDQSLVARSRQQAEQVLGVFFAAAGWNIQIRWSS